MITEHILDLFKVMVVAQKPQQQSHFVDDVLYGYVTDFQPSSSQVKILREFFKPLPLITLFSVEERKISDVYALVRKQILHYIEVYGLNEPGLFNLEVKDGTTVNVVNIKGVTVSELGDMVRKLVYAPNPIKEPVKLNEIIREYQIDYDINLVQNNELKTILFNPMKDTFNSGDDATRYLCYLATQNSLLIKSPEVLKAVKTMALDTKSKYNTYLERHIVPLSQVFNRHKNILISFKNGYNRSIINKIARLSKNNHVSIKEAINKNFISNSLNGVVKPSILNNADLFSIRDKFKYLNLLEYKISLNNTEAFIIRNGKVHLENNRIKYNVSEMIELRDEVLKSLKKDLKHLSKQKILLDKYVDYGLPVSRKQTMGNLPFGTTVSIEDDKETLSSGIYWNNDGGARDLDLSAIDKNGNRTGWGAYSGYSKNNDILFSGDITDARDGAMEFLTSSKNYDKVYGLFVNIFNGKEGSEAEIVVGHQTNNKWITEPVLREKINLLSKGNIIGFVNKGKFIVYNLRTSGQIVSNPKSKALISRGVTEFWTVKKLFDVLNIKFDVVRKPKVKYNVDMNYSNFSLDKLENLLYN